MNLPVMNDWRPILEEAMQTEAYQQLRTFLKQEYREHKVYPAMEHIWNAFEQTPYEKVKAVILGQDPYHGEGQAHGLSFSVQPGIPIPPSLNNIYKELQSDLGIAPVNHGFLRAWTEEGVLMLNTVLTVRAGEANSHRGKGWEVLTDHVIKVLNERSTPIVFILWGNQAIAKETMIDETRHAIIRSSHPSPLAAYRSFFGSQPFSKTNTVLRALEMEPINWELPHHVSSDEV